MGQGREQDWHYGSIHAWAKAWLAEIDAAGIAFSSGGALAKITPSA